MRQVLATDFTPAAAARVMNRLAKLSARFIGERGFSIGVDDVTPADVLQRRKRAIISQSYVQCEVGRFGWQRRHDALAGSVVLLATMHALRIMLGHHDIGIPYTRVFVFMQSVLFVRVAMHSPYTIRTCTLCVVRA